MNDYYVRFTLADGTHLLGDNNGQWFAVSDPSYGSEQTIDIGTQSSGAGAGRVSFDPLSFSLDSSAATTRIDQMLASGASIKSIELVGYDETGAAPVKVSSTVFKLPVAASADTIDIANGAHSLSFQYGAVVESVVTNDSGQLSSVRTAGWDRVKNVADNVTSNDALPHPDDPHGANGGTIEESPLENGLVYLQIRNADGSALVGLGSQWIAVESATVAEEQTLNIGSQGSGSGAGKVNFDPLQLTFYPGLLGPMLDQKLASGAAFQIELAVYKSTRSSSTVLTDDYQFGLAGFASHTLDTADDRILQTYTLAYGSERMTHFATNADGSAGAITVEGWNRVANVQQTDPSAAAGSFDSRHAPSNLHDLSVYSQTANAKDFYVRFTASDGVVLKTADGIQWLEITDATYSSLEMLNISAQTSGTGAGKVVFSPLSLTLGAGVITQQLDQMLASGTTLKSIELLGYQTVNSIGDVKTQNVVFKMAAASSDTIDIATNAHIFTFDYGAIVESAGALDLHGTVSNTASGGWDRINNVADTSSVSAPLAQRADDPVINGTRNGKTASLDVGIGQVLVYLQIRNADGTSLTGLGSQWIAVDAATVKQLQTTTIGSQAGGVGAGKVTFDPLTLDFAPGALGPLLDQQLALGKSFQVELAAYADKVPGSLLLEDYQFGLAAFASHTVTDGQQSYTLEYGSERIAHTVFNTQGTATGVTVEGWNRVLNVQQTTPSTANGGFDSQHAPTDTSQLSIYKPAPSANEYYVRFTGYDNQTLKGDGGGQWFAVAEADYASLQTLNIKAQSSGTGAGKVSFGPLSLTLGASTLTEKLDQMLESGTTLKTIEVVGYDHVNEQETKVSSTIFKTAAAASDTIDIKTGAHTMTFEYGAVVESVATTDSAGNITGEVTAGWDRVKNIADNATPNNAAQHPDDPYGHSAGVIENLNINDRKVYLQIRNIDGSALTGLGSQWIAVDAATVSQLQTLNISSQSSGAGAGKVRFNPLDLHFAPGALQPILDQKLASGTAFQVELAVYGSGANGGVLLDDYQFGLAAFASHTLSGDDQRYTLQYGLERMTHTVLNVKGEPVGTAAEGWNAITNTPKTDTDSAHGGLGAQRAPAVASLLSIYSGADNAVAPAAPAAPTLAHDTGVAGDRVTSDATISYPTSITGGTLLYALDGGSFGTTVPDIATSGQHTVSIKQFGNGLSSSATSLTFTLHASQAITGHDFNGDDFGDILFRDPTGNLASWQFATGGTVAGGGGIGNPGAAYRLFASGDLDGDGRTDVIFRAKDGSIATWLLNGTAIASGAAIGDPGTQYALLGTGDFNGDAKSDILFRDATTGAFASWDMNGAAIIGKGVIGNPDAAFAFKAVGDFDGDGKADILFQNADGSYASWLLSDTAIIGGGTIGNPGAGWFFEGVGDFNGDGRSDVLFENSGGTYATWDLDGAQIIGGGTIGNPGSGFSYAGIGDYNGDGRSDVVFRNNDGSYATWTLNDTTVTGGTTLANPGGGYIIANAHGASGFGTIVFQDSLSSTVASWQTGLNTIVGGGTFGQPGSAYTAIATGDFAGTGETDVLFRNSSGAFATWTTNGNTLIGGGAIGNPGSAYTFRAAADFNGDGKTDILFQNANGSYATWDVSGVSIIGGGTIGVAAGYTFAATGDINGDGKSDIIFKDDSGNYATWLINDTSIIGGGTIGNPGSGWTLKGAGDFNGDGRADILFQNTAGTYATWDLDGVSIIGGGSLGSPGGNFALAKIVDINGDGKSDLLFADSSDNYASWLISDTSIIGGGSLGTLSSNYHVV